jgi:hypothetical protein
MHSKIQCDREYTVLLPNFWQPNAAQANNEVPEGLAGASLDTTQPHSPDPWSNRRRPLRHPIPSPFSAYSSRGGGKGSSSRSHGRGWAKALRTRQGQKLTLTNNYGRTVHPNSEGIRPRLDREKLKFICIWQLVFNRRLTRLKRFVSWFITKLYN